MNVGQYKDQQVGITEQIRTIVMNVVAELDEEVERENAQRVGDRVIQYDQLRENELEDNSFINKARPNRNRYWSTVINMPVMADDEVLNKLSMDSFEYFKFGIAIFLGKNAEAFLYDVLIRKLEKRIMSHPKIYGYKVVQKSIDDLVIEESSTDLDVRIVNFHFIMRLG